MSLLQSCGFRLRGSSDLPDTIKFATVQGVAEFSEVGLTIKQHLTSAGAKVLSSADDSTTQFIVVRNIFSRRVLSVDSLGRANEYEIIYEFALRVTDAKGKILVPERTVNLSRNYTYDINNALAKSNEELLIKSQLIVLAVSQAMRRVGVKLRNIGDAPASNNANTTTPSNSTSANDPKRTEPLTVVK